MPSDTDARAEHDRNVAERRRYRIVRQKGEVDETRDSTVDLRTHNGDVVHEYYDDVLIREHKLTIQMLAGFEYGRPFLPRKTPVFETRWCIDAGSIALLPSVIVNGRWSDPAATFAAGRGVPPTKPEGEWGVYGANFTDAYTLGQIEPLEAQYKHLITTMQSARDSLYVSERFVNSWGLFDNVPHQKEQLQLWIDDCSAKIRTAQAKLTPLPVMSLEARNAPGPRDVGMPAEANMQTMLGRLHLCMI